MANFNTCRICGKKAIPGQDLCRTHYIESRLEIWLDNSDEDNPGIVKWLKDLYPEHYRDEFSKKHIKSYMMLLRLYDPRYKNKQHRLREIIAFRGFGKSKLIFGIISYILANNGKTIKVKTEDGKIIETKLEEHTMIILSETGGAAEEFVVNVRDEFSINERIKYFYHFTIQDAKDDETGQWTRRAFKMNNCFLIGLGAGMQVRGKVKGAYRPSFIFFDDIYSEGNTVTYESRRKIKRWFYNAALHSLDDINGKALLVGTIVHDDTVLVEVETNSTWKTMKFFPMPLIKFKKLVDEHTETNIDIKKCKLPYEDEPDEFKRISLQEEYFKTLLTKYDWEVTWPDRVGLYELLLKYKDAVENDNVAGFYQEYFHITIPDELRVFRPEYFQYISRYDLVNKHGYNFISIDGGEYKVINIEFGLDIAGGKKEGDSTVITATGMLSNGKIIVLEQASGKFSMRDVLKEDNPSYERSDKVILDKSFLSRVGYIDETFRLALKFRPSIIKIGIGGGHEHSILTEFIRVFRANNFYVNIIGIPQTVAEGNKFERIKNNLIGHYETLSVFHAKRFEQLEYQLLYLGKTKFDDESDSLSVSVERLQRPYEVVFPDEKKEEELNPFGDLVLPDSTDNWIEDWRVL